MLDIKLMPQEESVNSQFNGRLVMTSNFQNIFGDDAVFLAIHTLNKIKNERVFSSEGADYLQVCEYNGTRFWMIDDGVVTALMPEDY